MSVRRLSRRALACTQRAVHPCATLALCHARQQALVVRPRLRGRAHHAAPAPDPAPTAPLCRPAARAHCRRLQDPHRAAAPSPPHPLGQRSSSPPGCRDVHRPGAMATTFVHEGPSVPVRTKWTHEPRGSCRAGGRRQPRPAADAHETSGHVRVFGAAEREWMEGRGNVSLTLFESNRKS